MVVNTDLVITNDFSFRIEHDARQEVHFIMRYMDPHNERICRQRGFGLLGKR
jgi:hypothetical protein